MVKSIEDQERLAKVKKEKAEADLIRSEAMDKKEEAKERKATKLREKFEAVQTDIVDGEASVFKGYGTGKTFGKDFDILVECLIEGYNIDNCLMYCFGKKNIDLFKWFQKTPKDHKMYVRARLFSLNKVASRLNENLKIYKGEPVLYNMNADRYMRTIRDLGKADLAISKDSKEEDDDEPGWTKHEKK